MLERQLLAVAGSIAFLAAPALAQTTNSSAATPAEPAAAAQPATADAAAVPATPADPAKKTDATATASDPLSPTDSTVTNGKVDKAKKKAAAKKAH
ncbi:MAG TPA: hypothetical protein VK485_10475 [Sphingomicrobium sp.]|nr:hypothetical protein [Sphingomicrobium sp.]